MPSSSEVSEWLFSRVLLHTINHTSLDSLKKTIKMFALKKNS